jgi:type 1 fimbria pilin
MFIRDAFIASLLGIFGYASTAYANSCGNLYVLGTFDQSGLQEGEFGIYAAGTFRIEGEGDEFKQPDFNLTTIKCEKKPDGMGRVSLECKVTTASVQATRDKPDPDKPNCTLDLDFSEYSMKELQKGVLTGMEAFSSTGCYNTILTIDRNTKRVYMSFTRTKYADDVKMTLGMCQLAPRTQVLMNCTAWPKLRKGGQTPPRYCDFSSASDK